jgi:predicted dehydrogenase
MLEQPVRVAIIGCGAVAERHLAAAISVAECQLTLLVDRNLDRAKELAAAFGVSAVSADYREAVNRAEAAIVALPHHLHAPVSCELLKAGLHVLVEKPMATSRAECEAMLAAAESGQAVLAVGLMRRFLRSAQFARWLVGQGSLGQIQEFDFREGNVYNWPVKSDFLFRRETAGGGVLFDTGAHTLDLLLWWLGDADHFQYYDDSFGGIEADCELHLSMKSGAKGIVELSRTRDLRNTAILRGERGTLEVHLRNNWAALRSPDSTLGLAGFGLAEGSPEAKEQRFGDLFHPQLEHWLAAIQGRHPPMVPGAEAIRSIALIESCYAQRGHLVLPWVQPKGQEMAL